MLHLFRIKTHPVHFSVLYSTKGNRVGGSRGEEEGVGAVRNNGSRVGYSLDWKFRGGDSREGGIESLREIVRKFM